MGSGDREILFLTAVTPTQTDHDVKRTPVAIPIVRCALVGGLLAVLLQGRGQTPGGNNPAPAGFSFPYKEGGRVVFRFSGSRCSSVSLSELSVEKFTLETYNTNTGLAEWVGTAPQCIVSTAAREIHSPGPILLRQADGQFSISGEGFSWSHASDRLVISNRVHATFRATLFSPAAPAVPPS